jgi:hypothetical protein
MGGEEERAFGRLSFAKLHRAHEMERIERFEGQRHRTGRAFEDAAIDGYGEQSF